MSEILKATKTLSQFCNPHGYKWRITCPPNDGLWSVLIDYIHGSYEHRGDDLPAVICEAIAGVRRLV